MKISDYFKLPIEIEKIHFDEKHMVRELNIGDGGECKAVNLAVNNFDDMYKALKDITEMYVDLINSGDCGSWDPEKDKEVMAARKSLSKARGEQ